MFINPNTEISLRFTYIVDTTVTIAFVNHVGSPTKVSEPARHLLEFPRHSFTWNVITGQHNWRKRKILEALFIALRRPELNKKLLAHPIHPFPMGVT